MLHKQISKWIKDYAKQNKIKALVVGVSGGIDSSVVSTLCANTGLTTYALTLPIRQSLDTNQMSLAHAQWLKQNYKNVKHVNIPLSRLFDVYEGIIYPFKFDSELAFANSRSRMRMLTLYQVAQSVNGIVVGTGNKVEDFGVGFFTKYGDGGVDISPIADLMKSEVWQLGRDLGILQEIIDAPPTDGLWSDGRTDQDQLGMSYPDLEQAMLLDETPGTMTAKQKKQLKKYREIRAKNLHKMMPIPVFKKPV